MENKEEIKGLIPKVFFKDETCDFKDKLWNDISTRCFTADNTKSLPIHRHWHLLSAAASVVILLCLSISGYKFSQTSYSATSETLTVTLPDNSTAKIYANSTLKYNRISWLWKHDVSLEGKALFAGKHSKGFKVITSQGEISVLGTEFLVDATATALQVECFSGAVSVSTPQGQQILRKKEQVVCTDNGIQYSKIRPRYEQIDNMPLLDVLNMIEEIYDISVEGAEKHPELTYSGVIPTGNINEALELLLGSCNISYNLTNDTLHIY